MNIAEHILNCNHERVRVDQVPVHQAACRFCFTRRCTCKREVHQVRVCDNCGAILRSVQPPTLNPTPLPQLVELGSVVTQLRAVGA